MDVQLSSAGLTMSLKVQLAVLLSAACLVALILDKAFSGIFGFTGRLVAALWLFVVSVHIIFFIIADFRRKSDQIKTEPGLTRNQLGN